MSLVDVLIGFIKLINPIQIIITITLIYSFLKIDFKVAQQRLLFIILLVAFLCEFFSNLLIVCYSNINIVYNICFILNNSLWIILIYNILKSRYIKYTLILYLIFCFYNLFFFEKEELNYLTFISGAIIYLLIYLITIKKMLQNENETQSNNNNLILISAPVFIFIGLSLIFAFRSSEIIFSKIFHSIYIYDFIIYFVNTIYYLFIFYYIYKSKKINV